jgi:hypothetical protein
MVPAEKSAHESPYSETVLGESENVCPFRATEVAVCAVTEAANAVIRRANAIICLCMVLISFQTPINHWTPLIEVETTRDFLLCRNRDFLWLFWSSLRAHSHGTRRPDPDITASWKRVLRSRVHSECHDAKCQSHHPLVHGSQFLSSLNRAFVNSLLDSAGVAKRFVAAVCAAHRLFSAL